ncbi:transposase [Nostoc favosum]|uniref:Transposase n=1 Tax=Nostoc favosum CHAB5714 TaxID=2780399 RepID=A0ABS8IH33_9NOSO|nr:transposase [Nostoc favosum]MCC5603548.1 transposase [Nostoc favosum CHAB5714]
MWDIHPIKGKSYRNGKVFKCGHCGFEHDADVNAANNIAALGKSVSLPESPGMSCQLEGQLSLFPMILSLRLKPRTFRSG